ncbi:hypothetical protein AX774_g7808 [Zancudomyces culisetae]|uniref:Uncharacterized protein n=1 Tax=Zancudomyces culisetae TaxID=1213189 RepID=A0A1R1PCU4_ZANCU|nr:hypothetical protein AX774_g7808 [Zancudomyces culisetae]|eukprot:OMH78794.1 hypothetical protein AX774_g7808 [Zancudomyces culisetae]
MEKQNLIDMHYAQPSDSNQSIEDSNKSCILLDDDSNSMERQHESSENVGISKDTELVTTYDTKYSWIVLAGAVMSYFFIFGKEKSRTMDKQSSKCSYDVFWNRG